MVQKPEIQYVHQFYVYGSEAKVLELKPQKKKNRSYLPKAAPDEKIKIAIDPFALCGIVVAVAMLVLLVVGSIQYLQVCQEYQQMMDYVVTLQNENIIKEDQYLSKIDLADIEEKALALGMIPKEQATVVYISGEMPQPEPEMTIWQEICWYFNELFA